MSAVPRLFDPLLILAGDAARDGYQYARYRGLGPDQYVVVMRPQQLAGRRNSRYVILPAATGQVDHAEMVAYLRAAGGTEVAA